MSFKTQFPFTLPKGLVDGDGNVHTEGIMRLATAKDEIVPLQDYRVQNNRAYLVIVLLSRVIEKIGGIEHIDVKHIENLYSTDLAYLQEFYRKINEQGEAKHDIACPSCEHAFHIDMASGALVSEEGGTGRASGQG